MPNGITVQIEGQPYTLRFTTNACCEVETRSGRTFGEIYDGAQRGSITDCRWLFWTLLQAQHKAAAQTPEQAGDLIERAGGLPDLMAQILAQTAAMTATAAAPEISSSMEEKNPSPTN